MSDFIRLEPRKGSDEVVGLIDTEDYCMMHHVRVEYAQPNVEGGGVT